MFTPIGFFQSIDGLPDVIQDFVFYYDASKGAVWLDQSGNSNDGTETVIGSGGHSSITHNAGATPYWQFSSTQPTLESPFVETATAAGNFGTDSWCQFALVQVENLDKNSTFLDGRGNDVTTQLLSLNVSRQTDEFFANIRGGDGTNQQLFSDTISTDTWYFVILQWDSVEGTIKYYINGAQVGDSSTTSEDFDLDIPFKIGRNSLSSNSVPDSKVAAIGFAKNKALSFSERTELFDYYDEIYSIWSPKDIANAQYWWTADAGVTTSTGGVSVWTDQINSLTLEQSDSADRPSYGVSSNMNGQNTVTFNGTTDFLYGPSLPANLNGSDLTMLVSYYLPNTTPGDGVVFGHQYVGASQGRIWFDGFSGTIRFADAFGSNTSAGNNVDTIQDPIVAGKKFSKMRYDSSNGSVYFAQDTLTETTTRASGYAGQEWSSLAVLQMGAMLDSLASPTPSLGRYIEMEVTDVVVIYGTPTTEEMNRWATYIERKYGTVLS